MSRHSRSAAQVLAESVRALPQNRRRGHRQKISTLAYVRLDAGNGGVLRDVSESGIAMQTLSPVMQGQRIQVRIDLPNPRLHLEASGRVVWSDSQGQAGVEFGELSRRHVRLLNEWLFTQVLADAQRLSGDGELLFSTAARDPIRLPPKPVLVPRAQKPRALRILWFSLSAQKVSRVVDGLVLLCAVLLFSLMSLIMTDTLPSLPFAALFLIAVLAIFAALYWMLFALWFGVTPGTRLAQLAGLDLAHKNASEAAETMRFR